MKFHRLILRGSGFLTGDFELRELSSGDGKTATFFVGRVDGEPSVHKRNALGRWDELDAFTRSRVQNVVRDPAGETVVIPASGVEYAVPVEVSDDPGDGAGADGDRVGGGPDLAAVDGGAP